MCVWYGDGVGNNPEENSSCSLIRIR